MQTTYEQFCAAADGVLAQIADACDRAGRARSEVALLAVTKTHPAEAAAYAWRYGLPRVGENRVQEAAEKRALAPSGLKWDLIGHLQSNKAKLAADLFDRVQSVDSEKLLLALERAAAARDKRLAILLQINAGNDPAKFGAEPEEAERLLEVALQHPHLQVEGLMTIAPLSDDPSVAQRTFARLRSIRDDLQTRLHISLPELSMGMSGDLAAAIAEGSTLVRVGTALFGSRPAAPGA